jgi:hypothetical protein
MAKERRRISAPYEAEVTHDDGRLVEVTVRAVDGHELSPKALSSAFAAVLREVRQHERHEHIPVLDGRAPELRRLAEAWERSGSELTDDYLAHLALAYEVVARQPGRSITEPLAEVIGRPGPTVKGHIGRARAAGFITPTGMGRGGGKATDKAREVVTAGQT